MNYEINTTKEELSNLNHHLIEDLKQLKQKLKENKTFENKLCLKATKFILNTLNNNPLLKLYDYTVKDLFNMKIFMYLYTIDLYSGNIDNKNSIYFNEKLKFKNYEADFESFGLSVNFDFNDNIKTAIDNMKYQTIINKKKVIEFFDIINKQINVYL